MKREAVGHTKMKRLCRRMDIPLWQAIGLLESLWLLTGREAPRGDIGKLSNEDIALSLDYRGDENALIEALVSTGWLDRDAGARLSVHGWADHADDAVNMRLARRREHFIDGRAPKLTRLAGKERDSAHEFYSRAHAVSSDSAQNVGSSALPVPVPVPEPVPVINICASPSGDSRVGALSSIDDPPFETTEPGALFPVEKSAQMKPIKRSSTRDLTPDQERWFAAWWPAYWLHRSKKATREAFRKHVQNEARFQQVMTATRAQASEMLSREESKRPYGSTWLNQERWEDEAGGTQPQQAADRSIYTKWEPPAAVQNG